MRSVGVLLILFCAAPAAAQELSPAQEEARQHFAAGEDLAGHGEWAGALSEYEHSYELAEGLPTRYLIGLEIARASLELNRNQEVVRRLDDFLEAAPPDDEHRGDANRMRAEAIHRLALEGGPSPIGIAILAVGAASSIAGAILGGVALSQDGDARATCDGTRCTQTAIDSVGQAHDLAIGADALLWGGLGLATLGAILTVALGTSSSTSASAMCTDQGCRVAVAGRF